MRPALLATCLAAALVARDAFAAGAYDPDVDYLTLTTPHFMVVHPKGYEHIAIRAGKIAEDVRPRLVARYGYEPAGRTTIVIDDQTDFANGSAGIVPSKVITIFVTAPTEVSGLEEYDDWLQMVITHEMTHIWHLDMAFGLPWVGRLLFGKYIAMNQYAPTWVTEGFAVYEETMSSGAGRGRSSYVDMVLRMAALEDRFPGIDQGYRSYADWPFSNVAYFFGGRFQLFLARMFGEEALVHYHRAYASDPIPYLTHLPAWIAFDTILEVLWKEFEHSVSEQALETYDRVRSSTMGVTRPKRLTRFGGDLLGPRVSPDGKWIFFSTSSPVDGVRMRKIPLGGGDDQVLVNDTFSKAISFSPGGRAFYFQQTEINQRYYTHNSLLRYDLEKESAERVRVRPEDKNAFVAPSGSLRARDPDVSPDGKHLVFVQTPYGSNRLVLADIASDGVTISPRVLVAAEPDVQISNPRFDPSGVMIAVSRFKRGQRDIVLYDTKGSTVAEVTRDRAQDVDPSWSPDGKWLLFASDRTGIYNLYAYEVRADRLVQLTNLISGAYQPSISPDGTTIVFRGYSSEGFDVYTLPFDPASGMVVPIAREPEVPLDRAPRKPPALVADVPEPPPPAPFTGAPLPPLPSGWELDPYSPLPTLLPFHDNWNLFPTIAANEREFFGQLTHVGTDALDTQGYTLWINYGTATKWVGGGVSYVNDQLEPTFSITGATDARTFVIVDRNDQFHDFVERRFVLRLGLGLPIKQRHLISFAYIFEDRAPTEEPSDELKLNGRGFPNEGRFARVQLGYAYSNVRAFPHSISPERGWAAAVALEGLSRGLGSDYDQLVFTGEGRGYLSLPYGVSWLSNHVLASRLAIRVSAGPDRAERFRLGGVSGQSALTTTTEDFFPLRGLSFASLTGAGTINGSVEYRAPIVRVERGLWTLPVTFRVFHLALFSDFGRVFDRLDLDTFRRRFFEDFAVSAGGELRADVILWYSLGLSLRLGYAFLLRTPDPDLDATGAYFQIGSAF